MKLSLRGFNQKGYSLVEVIISAGLFVLAIGVVYSLLTQSIKANVDLSSKADEHREYPFVAQFISRMSEAGVSVNFLHMPVSVSCSDMVVPCIRSYNEANSKFTNVVLGVAAKIGAPGSVEFYRDHDATLIKQEVSRVDGMLEQTQRQYTEPLDLSKMTSADNLYVTWPLRNSSSPPFMLMATRNPTFVVSFDSVLAKSTINDDRIFVRLRSGIPTAANLQAILNEPIVSYNGADQMTFQVHYLKEIKFCVDQLAECETYLDAQVLSQSFKLPFSTVFDEGKIKKYALAKFGEIKISDVASLSPPATSFSNWSVGFFPQQVNLEKISSAFDLPTSDLRKWTHYYHIQKGLGELVSVSVNLYAYKITESNGIRNLVESAITFTSSGLVQRDKIVIDNLKNRNVFFMRRLGTKKLEIVLTDQ